ncbi:hypothetical protein [Shewanella waksmanii]|uniref:hypothetical protein n=1 Tax=Shewanella waksmanii TaxID=213783 RepID=UPI0037357420
MAWICQHCHTKIEENSFEVCWNCGCEQGQTAPIDAAPTKLNCLRCDIPLTQLGEKSFHEGARWGALGNLAELFVDKQPLDMYACNRCGKVEFFLPKTR